MPGPSEVSFAVQRSATIQWKTFFRAALPVAGVVGFLTSVQSALGWLILLPAGTVFTIYFYRRRQPYALTAWQGAKLGLAVGLLSFAFFALFFAGESLANIPAYRQAMEKLGEQALASNPSPESRQLAQAWFTGAHGVAIITTFLFMSTLFFLLLISSITGALVGVFSRD